MDKAERAMLLRKRFGIVGKLPYVGSGRVKAVVLTPSLPPKIYFPWPQIEVNDRRAPRWMKVPKKPEKPKPTPRPKHNAGISALTKIAAQAPKKLSKRYANAEALLAARARR